MAKQWLSSSAALAAIYPQLLSARCARCARCALTWRCPSILPLTPPFTLHPGKWHFDSMQVSIIYATFDLYGMVFKLSCYKNVLPRKTISNFSRICEFLRYMKTIFALPFLSCSRIRFPGCAVFDSVAYCFCTFPWVLMLAFCFRVTCSIPYCMPVWYFKLLDGVYS